MCGKNVIAQQPTGFISRQHAPTRGGGDSDGASIGVGIEGDRQGRVHLGGPGQHRVGGTSFFRIRKLDSGKVRIRLELLVHQVDVGDARGVQGGHGGGATDPVKCGEDDTQVARAAAHRRGALNIGIDQGLAGGLDRGAGNLIGERRCRRCRFDFTIGGEMIWAPPDQYTL